MSIEPSTKYRVMFETIQIHRRFFDDLPLRDFERIFRNELRKSPPLTEDEYEVEKTLLYLRHSMGFIRFIGAERLYNQLRGPLRHLIEKEYQIPIPAYFKLMQEPELLAGLFSQPLWRRIKRRLVRILKRV